MLHNPDASAFQCEACKSRSLNTLCLAACPSLLTFVCVSVQVGRRRVVIDEQRELDGYRVARAKVITGQWISFGRARSTEGL